MPDSSRSLPTLGFFLFIGFGLGYFSTVFFSAGIDSIQVMILRSRFMPVKGIVEKIFISTESLESPSSSMKRDLIYSIGVKIKYSVKGIDHWISLPLPVIQGIPKDLNTIDEVLVETDKFSPGQPIVVKKRNLLESDAKSLYAREFNPEIKKIIAFSCDPVNPELTSLLVGNGTKIGLGMLSGFTLGIVVILILCIQIYFRGKGGVIIGIAYLLSVLGILGGWTFATNTLKSRPTQNETSSQDHPLDNEVVFQKGMQMPEFPL